MNRIFLCAFLLFGLLACSREKPSDVAGQKQKGLSDSAVPITSQPGAVPSVTGPYAIEIFPLEATRNSTLYLNPKGFNLDDAKIEWLVNREPTVSPTPNYFKAAEVRKGEGVQAKARLQGKEIFSNTVQIRNALPELRTAKIMPEVFRPGDTLSIEATGADVDGDEVTLAYEWSRNGEPAGSGKRMEGQVKRGDKITITVTPFDGEAYGRALILQREVTNMPPVIMEDKRFNFDGKVWTYQVRATDPDNDPLTYSLKSGPEGMTIEPSTGFIRWSVPADFKGKAAAGVAVSDSHGGEAIYTFNVTISEARGR